jgi:transcriptional regulator GlxA family with amidase domain
MPRNDKKLIAFTLYPGVTPLDLVGPLAVLRDLKIASPYRSVVVGERVEPMPSDTPLQMLPATTFRDVPHPFAVFVPGGPGAVQAMKDESLLAYVRSAATNAGVVGSTGNGALVLAAAGLLEGRRAAIHWAYGELLETLGATFAQKRWIEDGKFLTSAGGSAGIDMMLYIVARLKGESRARLTQITVEYDPQPPFGGIDWDSVDGDLAGMTETLQGSQGNPRERTIALVLYPELTALDLIGPLQVLTTLEQVAPHYRVVVVGERIEPMATDVVSMLPDRTFAAVPHPDVVLVPGGRMATLRAMSDPAMRAYVRTATQSAEIVASVCTGSLILASVGLLEGRQATTNWFYRTVLERFGADYLPERWVEDGKFIMSAGVSAGIDMGLYLVSRLTDEATARRVQLAMDYDPQPPLGRIDWTQVPLLPRVVRGGIGLASPLIVAKPKRLTRSERKVQAGSASTS